jgi:hypothetical protein
MTRSAPSTSSLEVGVGREGRSSELGIGGAIGVEPLLAMVGEQVGRLQAPSGSRPRPRARARSARAARRAGNARCRGSSRRQRVGEVDDLHAAPPGARAAPGGARRAAAVEAGHLRGHGVRRVARGPLLRGAPITARSKSSPTSSLRWRGEAASSRGRRRSRRRPTARGRSGCRTGPAGSRPARPRARPGRTARRARPRRRPAARRASGELLLAERAEAVEMLEHRSRRRSAP